MHRALQLLLAITVLLCGLHVEPAWAHADDGHELVSAERQDTHGKDSLGADAAHAVHHHCPGAPAPAGTDELPSGDTATLLFARPAPALGSLTRAPPLEPPAF